MADISYSITMKVDKDNLSNSVAASGITATMNEVGLQSMTLALTTATVAISTASLSSVGMAFMRNLSTSTAQVGITAGGSFVPLCTMRAGEPQIFRMATGQDYAAVGTAGTRLRVDITEG